MATVAIRKMSVQYLTAVAGPTSHSPPPIDVAAMIAPGPITFSALRRPKGGGAGSSATSQAGSAAVAREGARRQARSRVAWRRKRSWRGVYSHVRVPSPHASGAAGFVYARSDEQAPRRDGRG